MSKDIFQEQNGWLINGCLNNIKTTGLFHGKMGICIYCYLSGRLTDNEEFIQIADNLLDEIYKQITVKDPVGFENGLIGIGWGIEYLSQHNFVEADTDDILSEIDMAVLKALTSDSTLEMNLGNGLVGYLYYLASRLRGKDLNKQTLAMELIKEMLVLVINKLDVCYNNSIQSISKDVLFDLFSGFAIQTNALTYAFEFGIISSKIERIITHLLPVLETTIPSLHSNRLSLACELKYMAVKIDNIRLGKVADFLLSTVDFNCLLYEIGDKAMGVRNGLCGLKYVLRRLEKILSKKSPYYDCVLQILNKFPAINVEFSENDKLIKPHTLGVSEGIIGTRLIDLMHNSENEFIYSPKAIEY